MEYVNKSIEISARDCEREITITVSQYRGEVVEKLLDTLRGNGYEGVEYGNSTLNEPVKYFNIKW